MRLVFEALHDPYTPMTDSRDLCLEAFAAVILTFHKSPSIIASQLDSPFTSTPPPPSLPTFPQLEWALHFCLLDIDARPTGTDEELVLQRLHFLDVLLRCFKSYHVILFSSDSGTHDALDSFFDACGVHVASGSTKVFTAEIITG